MSTSPTRIPRVPGAPPPRRVSRRSRRVWLLGLLAVVMAGAAAGWFLVLRDSGPAEGGDPADASGTPALVRYDPATGVVELLDGDGAVVWTTTLGGGPYTLPAGTGSGVLMVAADGDLTMLALADGAATEIEVPDGLTPYRIDNIAVLTDPADDERLEVVDLRSGRLADMASLGAPTRTGFAGITEAADGAVVLHTGGGAAQFTLAAPTTIWWSAGQLVDAAATVSLMADERDDGAPTVLRRYDRGVQTGKAVIVNGFMAGRLTPQGALVVDDKGGFLAVDFESGSTVPTDYLPTQLVGYDTVRFAADDRLLAGIGGKWSLYKLDGTLVATVDAAQIVPNSMGGQLGWARSGCALMNVPDTVGDNFVLVVDTTTGEMLSVLKGTATAAPTPDGCTFFVADGRNLQLLVDGLTVDLDGTPVALSPDHTQVVVQRRRSGRIVHTLMRLAGATATTVRELEGDDHQYAFVMV